MQQCGKEDWSSCNSKDRIPSRSRKVMEKRQPFVYYDLKLLE